MPRGARAVSGLGSAGGKVRWSGRSSGRVLRALWPYVTPRRESLGWTSGSLGAAAEDGTPSCGAVGTVLLVLH